MRGAAHAELVFLFVLNGSDSELLITLWRFQFSFDSTIFLNPSLNSEFTKKSNAPANQTLHHQKSNVSWLQDESTNQANETKRTNHQL